MLLTLARLSRYGFNRKSLTLDDFYRITEDERIIVLERDIDNSFYMCVDGHRFIVLSNRRSSPLEFLYTAFHELYHALMSPPGTTAAAFYHLRDSKDEYYADVFAAIAIIPKSEIGTTDLVTHCCCGFAQIIYDMRLNTFSTYGI